MFPTRKKIKNERTILLFVLEIKFNVEFRCDGSLYAYVEIYSSSCFTNILVNA